MENTYDAYVCRLIICRNIAPANMWHWSVELPDGHMWNCSEKSYDSLAECMENANTDGVRQLNRADLAWAKDHPHYAKVCQIDVLKESH